MKVLVVTEVGVDNRYWESSLNYLKKFGIDVLLATIREHDILHQKLESRNIPSYALNSHKSRTYPFAILKLIHLIRKEKYDVIHSSEPIPTAVSSIASYTAKQGCQVYHRHHTRLEEKGLQQVFNKIACRLSHLTIAVSEATAKSAAVFDKVEQHRIRVAHNGIEELRQVSVNEVTNLRDYLKIPENAQIISIVARLRPVKGHKILFEAAQLVAKELTVPLHIVVVGSGEEQEKLEKEARELTEVTVHFVGHQSDVALWFHMANVIALPSHFESLPLSAIEAMFCGKPLIASKVGGLPELIEDGVSGILVPPGDSSILAEKLLQVLKSTELTNKLGAAARQKVQTKFTVEAMIKSWIDCYDYALSLSDSRKTS